MEARRQIAMRTAALECFALDSAEFADTAKKATRAFRRLCAAFECIELERLECDPSFPSSDVD